MHTTCVYFLGERSMHDQLSRGLTVRTVSFFCSPCSTHAWTCLMRAVRLAIPLAPVPLLPRHSTDCCHGAHEWIQWRDSRRAHPYLGPHQLDPWLPLRDRKPALWFIPPGERARRFIYLSSSLSLPIFSIVPEGPEALLQAS